MTSTLQPAGTRPDASTTSANRASRRRRARTLAPLACSAALVAVFAAGCGGGDDDSASTGSSASSSASASSSGSTASGKDNGVAAKTATDILAASKAAAEKQSSVHVSGTTTEDGGLSIDLTLSNGKGGTGSITIEGQKLELSAVGGVYYIKGDAAFWTQQAGSADAATLLADKWVKIPAETAASDDFAEFGDLVGGDFGTLFDDILSPTGTLTKGTTDTIAGTKAIGLVDSGEDGGTLWVATTGEPLPLRLDSTGSASASASATAGSDSISFKDWGKAVTLTAPADAVDLAALEAGASDGASTAG
jgi:hypothetical protein